MTDDKRGLVVFWAFLLGLCVCFFVGWVAMGYFEHHLTIHWR